MRRGFSGKISYVYFIILLLALFFVVVYLNPSSPSLSSESDYSPVSNSKSEFGNVYDNELEIKSIREPKDEKCTPWKTTCHFSVYEKSDRFDGPDAQKSAKDDALAKCEAEKSVAKSKIDECISGYGPFCKSPCQLFSVEREDTTSDPCKVTSCQNIIDPGHGDLVTICSYSYLSGQVYPIGSCVQYGRTPLLKNGWECIASDGGLVYDVICAEAGSV